MGTANEAVPEPVTDEGTAAQTLRLAPQTLAQLAAGWAEQLERRAETGAAGADLWGALTDEVRGA